MVNKEILWMKTENWSIREGSSDFRDVDFLFLVIQLWFDEKQRDEIIALCNNSEFLKWGFKGLIQFTKKLSLSHQSGVSIFNQLKEQLQFHDRIAKLSYEIDSIKQFFSFKSIGLLKLSSLVHGLSKNSLWINREDIVSIENSLKYYKKLYVIYKNVEKNEFFIWSDLSDKVLKHLEKMFSEPNLDFVIIDKYENLLTNLESLKIQVRKSIEKYTEVWWWWFFSPQNHKKKESPFKDFLDVFFLYVTKYVYDNSIAQVTDTFLEETQIEKIVFQIYKDDPTLFKDKNLWDLIIYIKWKDKIALWKLIQTTPQEKKQEKIVKELENPLSVSSKGNDMYPNIEKHKELLSELLNHSDFPRILSFKHDKKQVKKSPQHERSLEDIIHDISRIPSLYSQIPQFLKDNIPSGNKKSFEIVRLLYAKNILNREQSYQILEGKLWLQRWWVTLTEMIKVFWLHHDFMTSFEAILWMKIHASMEVNLKKLFTYFLFMESSWGFNVSNYEEESSAEWYFQYLAWNGKKWKEVLNPDTQKFEVYNSQNKNHITWVKENSKRLRTIWKPSSFDTALMSIPESIKNTFSGIHKNLQFIWNPQKQSLLLLNSSEQMILFFADIVKKDSERVKNIIFNGRNWDIPSLYAEVHHTNPDEATKSKMKLAWAEIK